MGFNTLDVWRGTPKVDGSILSWIIDNRIVNEKREPIEFHQHRFLKDIYKDFSPIIAVNKSAQIGFSIMKVLKTLYAAKFKKWNIIYTLPTYTDVNQFVPSKVNSLITNNKILARWTHDKDTTYQKKVGDSFIYYRGTFSGKKEKMEAGVGIMLSSDLNVHDECDRSDQTIIEQYESRLEASDFGGKWYFSNPTSPHTISQKYYEKSDQKHWFIKCSHCNRWQYLDFHKNIANGKYVCERCKGEITNEDRINGQWVKKYADKKVSGYWISHLICPWIPASKIEEEEKTKGKQYFYNFVLGLPYVGTEVRVDKNIILKSIDLSKPNDQQHNVLGVDQGIKKHWVLTNNQGIFKIGKTEKWEDIEQLIKVYDVEMCVIDAMPDITMPRRLRDKYPGRVWLNYFRREIRKADFILWDNKTHTVFSDRTKIIQQAIDRFVNREIRIQIKAEELEEYINHWQALYKVTELDNLGIERDTWQSVGDDHFTFATLYAIIGLTRTEKGGSEIKSWQERQRAFDGLAPDIQEIINKQSFYE
jgi:hypothetical protein